MKLLITGGTGFLGRYLGRMALDQGHQVALLGRDFTSVGDLLTAGATPVRADLRDHAAVVAACAGVEAVIHAGALSAPWGRREDFFAINVGGTKAVLAGCQQHGVARLVYVSSPSVTFAGHDLVNQPENAPRPPQFASVYSLTKALGEDRVNEAHAAGLATVTLRPKAIFGPGDNALLPRLLDAARRGRLFQIGDGRNRVDLTYVENVAHAALLALAAPAAVGGTYTITNDAHPLLWVVIRLVLRHLRLSANLRRVPLAAVLLAATALEIRASLTGQEPLLTRYSAAILARTQTYDTTAARRDLSYTPVVSLADGIERTVAALQRQGG